MNENTNSTAAEIAAQETTQTASTTDNAQQAQQAAQQPERTFTQADVDRMIADRLSRERRQHQQDIETARTEGRTEGRTEAERLAQMTAEQRAQAEQQRAQQAAQQREQALNQREADITRRELRAQAIDTLVSRDLPPALESVLDYTSADACNASIDNVERVFREAVQKAVDARLKASGVSLPAPGSKPDYDRMSDADYYATTLGKK